MIIKYYYSPYMFCISQNFEKLQQYFSTLYNSCRKEMLIIKIAYVPKLQYTTKAEVPMCVSASILLRLSPAALLL